MLQTLNRIARDFAGTRYGRFFEVVIPDYVDVNKPPGRSTIPRPTFSSFLITALKHEHMFLSPNLVWLLLTILFYLAFPYDLSATGAAYRSPVSFAFFRDRFPPWFFFVGAYVAFFSITLDVLGWDSRPFLPNRRLRPSRMIHNIFYNIQAIVIWVVMENLVCFCWARGSIFFVPDSAVYSASPKALLWFWLVLTLTPLWRDAHFFFIHRAIHFPPLYRYIHSLHHRCTSPDATSGLSMHAIEQVFYYASILPNLLIPNLSPLHFLFNGVHLLLAPAASHSGFESHFQNDSYHYLHHHCFEKNYAGAGANFLDTWAGSLRVDWPKEKNKNNSSSDQKKKNKNSAKENQKVSQKQEEAPPSPLLLDAKATLVGLPPLDHIIFNCLSVGCLVFSLLVLIRDAQAVSFLNRFFPASSSTSTSTSAAAAVSRRDWFVVLVGSFGPVLSAVVLWLMFDPGASASLRWNFEAKKQKADEDEHDDEVGEHSGGDKSFGVFVVNVVLGFSFTVGAIGVLLRAVQNGLL